MTLNVKRDGFTLDDFRACAKAASMKRGRTEAILEEVRQAVARWRDFAVAEDVPPPWRDRIYQDLRINPLA